MNTIVMPPGFEGFRTIVIDPPWNETGGGRYKRGADRHYPVMKVKPILRTVLQSGVWLPHPEGCVLWLWTTNTYLPDALWLADALNFRYVTNMVWVKAGKMGLGQWLRQCHELSLLCVAGKRPVSARTDLRNLRGLVNAPRTGHSRKPQDAFNLFEARSPGPRLEMFAREPRSGWAVWGNEISPG